MGTFLGYGGYYGINPYREVPADANSLELGAPILELLELAGPTGISINEAKDYLDQTEDEETRRIKEAYGFGKKSMTTSVLARRFLQANITHRHRQKSWQIQRYSYDSQMRSMSGAEHKPIRIRQVNGAVGLGLAVRFVLKLDRTPKRKGS